MSVPYSYRDLKVSNVKISFKLKEKIDFNLYHDNYLLYDHKTLKICKFDQYTATFMGKNHTFVNVTGLKSFCDIIRSKQLFCDEFNIRLTKLYDVKIDTISGVFNIPKFSLHNILKKLTYHNYKITKFSHFCGVKVVLSVAVVTPGVGSVTPTGNIASAVFERVPVASELIVALMV